MLCSFMRGRHSVRVPCHCDMNKANGSHGLALLQWFRSAANKPVPMLLLSFIYMVKVFVHVMPEFLLDLLSDTDSEKFSRAC